MAEENYPLGQAGEEKSSLSAQAQYEESAHINQLRADALVGLRAIVKKRYLQTVSDASDQDPPSFDGIVLHIGKAGEGFSAFIKINFKMNPKPNSLVDWINYTTPLILIRPVTFRMEIDHLSLPELTPSQLDPGCPVSLETAQDIISSALQEINKNLRIKKL